MRQRVVRLITATGMALATSVALVSATGLAAASTSPATGATKELFLAGYHFTVSKTTSLTVKGSIKVPTITCGNGDYVLAPQVVVHYHVGNNLDTASAQLGLGCTSGFPVYGDPVLLVGNKTVNIQHQVTPGETVAITITITKSTASVKIAYSTTGTDSGTGGSPADAQYSVALPAPPAYSPVKFSGCTANGKDLSSYNPGAWQAVNKSGKALGTPSKITSGTVFSVTE